MKSYTYIIASLHGRTGKTLLARLFADNAILSGQYPEIFDTDDFVDPRELAGRGLFISRAYIGAAAGYGDQYRPLHQTIGFVHLSTALYWHGLQATYKHTEIRGSDDWSARSQPQPTGTALTQSWESSMMRPRTPMASS